MDHLRMLIYGLEGKFGFAKVDFILFSIGDRIVLGESFQSSQVKVLAARMWELLLRRHPLCGKRSSFQGPHLTPFINTVFNLEVINVVLGSVLIAQVGTAGASMSAAGQERTTETMFAPGFDVAEKARQSLKLWRKDDP